MNKTPLEKIFTNKKRVAGIAGNRHQGKTNNIIRMVVEQRNKEQKQINALQEELSKLKGNSKKRTELKNKLQNFKPMRIYAYGLPSELFPLLEELNVKVVDTLKQLINKKNCLLILDEFQQLNLGDRRYKQLLQEFMAFVYHKNVYVLFCSPTTREYTSIIGGYIEVWLLKSMYVSDCVNGSQLKKALDEYKGEYCHLGYFDIPKGEMVVLNDEKRTVLTLEYVEEADTKKKYRELF